MNKETFAKYISNPSLLDNDSLPEIKAMLDEFPYFQSAWVLYIKNLHSIKDIRYESKLKTACAYISDRKHMHDVLKGIAVQPQNIVAQQPEILVNTTAVQTQNIASQEKENNDEIDIVQTQKIASQREEIPEDTSLVQTQNVTPQEKEIYDEIDIVKTQKIASQREEIPEDTSLVQTQNVTPQEKENSDEIDIVKTQDLASQPEKNTEEKATVQPQNIEDQQPEIQATEIPESSNNQIFESSNNEPEEPETRNIETQKPESSNLQIIESSNLEPEEPETRNIETQKPESSNLQISESSNLEPEEPETRNIETQKPESSNLQIIESSNLEPEEPETRNIETQKPETEPPAFHEPDKPESLADRILRQAEEMRRAKAAAAAAIENETAPEIVKTQKPESQREEISEDTKIVQTQNNASQPEEQTPEIIKIAETAVQQQSIEALPEESVEPIIISQEEETYAENAFVKTQDLASQREEIPEDTTIVQTQNIASQPEIQDTEIPESSNLQIIESSNHQIFESSNQETQKPETINAIDQSQIRELIEKQLHSLGINANITFSGNSANIQFENIATNEKPEENLSEQSTTDNELSTEIQTTPSIEEQIEKRKNDRDKKANLIDKFIESKAKIVPRKDYHSDNKLSTESIIEDEELFTEQLAKIYIKQGHLEKALETYEKLYLKYPEKNIYFATRIEYVKRLMNK